MLQELVELSSMESAYQIQVGQILLCHFVGTFCNDIFYKIPKSVRPIRFAPAPSVGITRWRRL